jgi:hypothetical protein
MFDEVAGSIFYTLSEWASLTRIFVALITIDLATGSHFIRN